MKKKIILGAASVASIIAPVAAVVACGSETHHSLDYDASKPLVGNTTGKDFFENKDVYKETFNSNLSKYDKQVSFVLYDQEVEAAYNLQLGDFEFKKFKKQQEKEKAEKKKKELEVEKGKLGTSDDKKKKALKTQIDAKAKEIKDLTSDIDKLDKNIKTATDKKVDFDSSSFGSDFPLLLKPFKNIKKAKDKYFQDQKDQFFKTFGPNEGAKKWPEEMRKKFGGAENEQDAIIWLASNEISNVAKGAFSFRINNQYTVEQYIWAVVTNNKHWTFLSDDKVQTNTVTPNRIHVKSDDKKKINDELKKTKIADVNWDLIDSIKDKKVFFISSNSKKVFPLDKKTETDFLLELKKTPNLIKVQNGIIPFVRQEDPNKPWKIKENELKKLLYFYGNHNGGNQERQGISFFFDKKMYEQNQKDWTTMTLHLGTTDSSSDVQGSLGIMKTLKYIRTMKPGFGLGVLDAISKIAGVPAKTITYGNSKTSDTLSYLINKKKTELVKKYHLDNLKPTTATGMNSLVDKLFAAGKDDVLAGFGSVIRDYFSTLDGNDKGSLSYKIGTTNNFLVLSTFGMHIIHLTNSIDTNTLKKDVKEDLDNMAKEQKTTSSTGITSLVTAMYSDKFNYYTKLTGDKKIAASLKTKLDEYNKGVKDSNDQLSIKKLTELINRVHTSKIISEVSSSLGNAIPWYKKQLDNKLKNPAVKVDEIYTAASKVVA